MTNKPNLSGGNPSPGPLRTQVFCSLMSPSQSKTQPGSRKPTYEAATKSRPSPGHRHAEAALRSSREPGSSPAAGSAYRRINLHMARSPHLSTPNYRHDGSAGQAARPVDWDLIGICPRPGSPDSPLSGRGSPAALARCHSLAAAVHTAAASGTGRLWGATGSLRLVAGNPVGLRLSPDHPQAACPTLVDADAG